MFWLHIVDIIREPILQRHEQRIVPAGGNIHALAFSTTVSHCTVSKIIQIKIHV
jgi:hypothetical protein